MRLEDLRPAKGSTKKRKRVGRGRSSGTGKTSGRGHKGLKARSGGGARPGFEGGQMPLYRRLPKRGFKVPFPKHFNEIGLAALQAAVDAKRIDPANTVTAATLVEAGVLRREHDGVRILGDGELKTKLNFEVAHATKGATEQIEKLGGSIKLLKPVVHLAATGKQPKDRPNKRGAKKKTTGAE